MHFNLRVRKWSILVQKVVKNGENRCFFGHFWIFGSKPWLIKHPFGQKIQKWLKREKQSKKLATQILVQDEGLNSGQKRQKMTIFGDFRENNAFSGILFSDFSDFADFARKWLANAPEMSKMAKKQRKSLLLDLKNGQKRRFWLKFLDHERLQA